MLKEILTILDPEDLSCSIRLFLKECQDEHLSDWYGLHLVSTAVACEMSTNQVSIYWWEQHVGVKSPCYLTIEFLPSVKVTSVILLVKKVIMKCVVLTCYTYHCCLSHRYRPGRQHSPSLSVTHPRVVSIQQSERYRLRPGCLVCVSVICQVDRERKAGAPRSSRWQCFSSEVRGPSTRHLFTLAWLKCLGGRGDGIFLSCGKWP